MTDKCEHLVIINIRVLHCALSTKLMNIVSVPVNTKYLGVIIDHNLVHDLSWADHIGTISHKANAIHAFLQRNLRKCSTSIKSLA